MDRVNHVKIVTPEPEAVDRFLREVLDIPEGWEIPRSADPGDHASPAVREVTWERVLKLRGDDGSGGFISDKDVG